MKITIEVPAALEAKIRAGLKFFEIEEAFLSEFAEHKLISAFECEEIHGRVDLTSTYVYDDREAAHQVAVKIVAQFPSADWSPYTLMFFDGKTQRELSIAELAKPPVVHQSAEWMHAD